MMVKYQGDGNAAIFSAKEIISERKPTLAISKFNLKSSPESMFILIKTGKNCLALRKNCQKLK
jgi:hypothetical protein